MYHGYILFFLLNNVQAARKFVDVSADLGSSFDGVVAPEDIAVYGGLCALATFSREEMKRRVLENTSFKNFLDLVPQVYTVTGKPLNHAHRTDECFELRARFVERMQNSNAVVASATPAALALCVCVCI